ncbi:putative membrane protein YfcA [Nocardia transvalensis]|uniref:Probable membrane transporter protein n=1 Tax=Nocardia transvalensis TaxID=37333 RepID=A0A7W9PBA4_9NOCA|nr:anion permease [Nocardia transvalensis]MBB5912937.1 putative membrane protein YfcA [Nocardia transvalensis]
MLIAVFIAIGAVAGAISAVDVPDIVLHILFAVYLAVTIADTAMRSGFFTGPDHDADLEKPLGRFTSTVGGLGIGAVASFLGGGSSVITVPLLLRRHGRPWPPPPPWQTPSASR